VVDQLDDVGVVLDDERAPHARQAYAVRPLPGPSGPARPGLCCPFSHERE
jgi:hypothetical protein